MEALSEATPQLRQHSRHWRQGAFARNEASDVSPSSHSRISRLPPLGSLRYHSPNVDSLSNIVRLLVSLHALRQRETDTETLDFPHNAALEVHLAGDVLNKTAQVLLPCQLASPLVEASGFLLLRPPSSSSPVEEACTRSRTELLKSRNSPRKVAARRSGGRRRRRRVEVGLTGVWGLCDAIQNSS